MDLFKLKGAVWRAPWCVCVCWCYIDWRYLHIIGTEFSKTYIVDLSSVVFFGLCQLPPTAFQRRSHGHQTWLSLAARNNLRWWESDFSLSDYINALKAVIPLSKIVEASRKFGVLPIHIKRFSCHVDEICWCWSVGEEIADMVTGWSFNPIIGSIVVAG